jgi:hypothetical protein
MIYRNGARSARLECGRLPELAALLGKGPPLFDIIEGRPKN